MNISIKTDTLTPDLKKKLAKVENPAPCMRAIGTLVESMARDAFTNESIRPTAWDALTARTLEKKKKRGYGSKELIASGVLARSPLVLEATEKGARVGSDRRAGAWSLAAIHQLGAPKRNIPPRPFFPFFASGEATETAKKRVRDVIVAWLKK